MTERELSRKRRIQELAEMILELPEDDIELLFAILKVMVERSRKGTSESQRGE